MTISSVCLLVLGNLQTWNTELRSSVTLLQLAAPAWGSWWYAFCPKSACLDFRFVDWNHQWPHRRPQTEVPCKAITQSLNIYQHTHFQMRLRAKKTCKRRDIHKKNVSVPLSFTLFVYQSVLAMDIVNGLREIQI